MSYAVEVSPAEWGVGEKASILPRSRKPASSLRAGERRPTSQARPPPRAPGRELTPLHPLAVPATSLSPARASHWGSAATRISPAVPLTRMLMFICTTLCRQCFHRWTQLCRHRHRRTSKSSNALGHHCRPPLPPGPRGTDKSLIEP